jgi:hypothetical protein
MVVGMHPEAENFKLILHLGMPLVVDEHVMPMAVWATRAE